MRPATSAADERATEIRIVHGPMSIGQGERCVRVVRIRQEGFVEFEFFAGSPELAVEMIMSPGAFREFCRAQGARLLSDEEAAEVARHRARWAHTVFGEVDHDEDEAG